MTGQASWIAILMVVAVLAGIAGFWLRERWEARRGHH